MYNKYVQAAIDEAKKSCMDMKHGAVLVDKSGKIIAKSYNKPTCDRLKKDTHFRKKIPGSRVRSLHAEIAVSLGRSIAGCIIYVVRMTKKGDRALSKPCKSCTGYLIRKKISRVYYSV